MKRLVIDILLLAAIFICPPFLALIFAFVLFFFFDSFYEMLFVGFLIDSAFSTPSHLLFGFQFFYTALCVLLFCGAFYLKKRIVYYPFTFS